jgi:hypothetical protein
MYVKRRRIRRQHRRDDCGRCRQHFILFGFLFLGSPRSLARTRANARACPSALRYGTERFQKQRAEQEQRRWVPAFAGTTGLGVLFAFAPPGPSRPRRGRGGQSPQGRAHEARAFAVRPGRACQRTSVAPLRSRRLHRRPRSRGSPLFGYFLWRNRESDPLAGRRAEPLCRVRSISIREFQHASSN